MGSLRKIRGEALRQPRLDDDFHHAIYWGKLEQVKSLLDQGASLRATNEYGDLPLAAAVDPEHLELMQLLLDHGTDIDARDGSGRTALLFAAMLSDLPDCHLPLEFLISRGADVNVQDHKGWTALMYAANVFETKQIRLLVDAGADPSLVNNQGQRAIDELWHSQSGDSEFSEIVRLLSVH